MSTDFKSLPIDDLLQQLRDTPTTFVVKSQDTSLSAQPPPVSSVPIKEEDLGEYIIQKTTSLVEQTMSAFSEIKSLAIATNDGDTISALADMVKAANSAIDSLNKIHMQNKKLKGAKEVAQIQVDARIKQLENQQQQPNILTVTTREEVLKILEQAKSKTAQIIDAEITEVSNLSAIK